MISNMMAKATRTTIDPIANSFELLAIKVVTLATTSFMVSSPDCIFDTADNQVLEQKSLAKTLPSLL
jgi:hypothetical protein